MGFASVAFKKPWQAMVKCFHKLSRGEKVTRQEALVDPFFFPAPVDARLAYALFKTGLLRLFMAPDPSLFTLILSKERDRLVWACVEGTSNGVYTELYELKERLSEPWAERALHFIQKDNLSGCYAYLKNWLKQEKELSHINLGAIKVASLGFFEAFLDAFEQGKQESVLTQQRYYLQALLRVLRGKEVQFYPPVPLYRLVRLGEVVARVLPAGAAI